MKWIPQDIEMYLKSKEYVDTAVIPLLPVTFTEDMKQAASMAEFVTLLSYQMERQFKGRLMMLPGFSYLKSDSGLYEHLGELKKWESAVLESGFKHVFYLTSDSGWKMAEGELGGSLLWLPSLPLEHMDDTYRNSVLEDQVKQLMNLLVQKWQAGE
ncbi:YpiF family protein [Bacillus infantis]|uniref:YpiF family protein n=1 Tax=Bacillus infantis TaxID=324767 RepID=UPI001CD54F9B|nr:YpiF family protein [Bacillus infantis]MCA1039816.1 YpiF family protein [Bacillus infantis]